jgi:sugar lactone lactonase YvrE
MKAMKSVLVAALLVLAASFASAQFDSSFASAGASEQFRLGVQAYQRGRFAEAILLFEKSLAWEPDRPLVSYWLGRAYIKSGFESTALRAWAPFLADPAAPPFIRAKAETLQSLQNAGTVFESDVAYVETARFEGKRGRATYFLRPSSLLPLKDGSVLVVAQGSNEILTIDPNGVIKDRMRGGLQGFDRPWAAASLPDGTLFVTEFNGDRISRIGGSVGGGKPLLFGTKGRGEGQIIGPQYAVCDDDGYLYVTDYGNARVVKFDPDGGFVLAFGGKSDAFPGFVSPAGLAEKDGVLYAADSFRKAVYRFDSSGNYLGALAEGVLHFPEGLGFWQNGSALLIADTDRIVSIDLDSERPSVVYQSPDKKARLVAAAEDFNGDLLACDFDASAVLVLTEAPLIAAGYDVEIERIHSDAFPKVTLDVSVRDRLGRPVVGLKQPNFHLSERVVKDSTVDERGKIVVHHEESLVPAADMEFLGSAAQAQPINVVLLLDRSPAMGQYRDALRDSITSLFNDLSRRPGAGFALVTAGSVPQTAVGFGGGLADLTRAAITTTPGPVRFDLGLRFAVTSLLPTNPRDAVIYLGTGLVDEASFGGMTLAELAALMRNNGVHFYAVLLGDGAPAPSLRFLVEQSGGGLYYAARPRGLGDLAADIVSSASGRYRLGFTSVADPAFGDSYLTVAAEAYLYKKSGRDELGYFAPRK